MAPIPKIERLLLPTDLPSARALDSFQENATNYHPDFWDIEYVTRRYLVGLDDHTLGDRYRDIVRNMRALISDEGHVVPIQSELSSWYWYRKEHQTRLEFAVRDLPLPYPMPAIATRDLSSAPARPHTPNGEELLFRYGEQRWMRKLADSGGLRINSASVYAEMEDDPARYDNEKIKERYSPGSSVTITLPTGKKFRPIGDLKYTASGIDYFLYCVSNDWDPDLFVDFRGADACVVIHDPEEFAKRLAIAATQLSDWRFHFNPVGYFDPYERQQDEHIDNATWKDFRFAYQRETQFVWAGFGRTASGFIDLELGSLSDIASFHERP